MFLIIQNNFNSKSSPVCYIICHVIDMNYTNIDIKHSALKAK
jgi:hypothetical protein